jgi:glyoxylase-like metal-dependent hydrolase (beta-lactamase superfamily II)
MMVNSMTENGNGTRCQSEYFNLRRISVSEDWFEVYEIASNLFAFCETRHYENTTVSLIIGPEKAALIDTGSGIGNLRKAIAEVTDKPVIVINTHTHLDHLGGNRQFDEIAMFDHPLSRRVAVEGASPSVVCPVAGTAPGQHVLVECVMFAIQPTVTSSAELHQ